MPRKIDRSETLADLHAEVDYTIARIADEALAADQVAAVEAWKVPIDAAEKLARDIDREEAHCEAARQGSNLALDAAVVNFGDDLHKDVGKDRAHPRVRGHFRELSISAFNRQDFTVQVPTVRAWLTESKDPALEAHRAALEEATARSERALVRTNALATKRTSVWEARADLAASLTEKRDARHDDLSRVGRANKLPRGWADSFFRTGASKKKPATNTAPGGTPDGGTPPA